MWVPEGPTSSLAGYLIPVLSQWVLHPPGGGCWRGSREGKKAPVRGSRRSQDRFLKQKIERFFWRDFSGEELLPENSFPGPKIRSILSNQVISWYGSRAVGCPLGRKITAGTCSLLGNVGTPPDFERFFLEKRPWKRFSTNVLIRGKWIHSTANQWEQSCRGSNAAPEIPLPKNLSRKIARFFDSKIGPATGGESIHPISGEGKINKIACEHGVHKAGSNWLLHFSRRSRPASSGVACKASRATRIGGFLFIPTYFCLIQFRFWRVCAPSFTSFVLAPFFGFFVSHSQLESGCERLSVSMHT